jgi:glycosyltransferase involved in cell wall biosynthesis
MQDLLGRAFGVETPLPVKCWYALRNYSAQRDKWVWKRLSDVGYRNSLTRLIEKRLVESDFGCDFLQLGAIYDLPSIVKGRSACYSYNDGNTAMALRSPYFPPGISRKKIEATLKYEREVNAGLDVIFTMSEFLRQSFIDDCGVDPAKVVCIGAGINIDMPAIEPSKDYSKASILFIGVNFARKGGYDVLKAFRIVRERVPHATLHIVGPRERCPDAAEMEGTVWHGFLDKNNEADARTLAGLMREATVFAMPSLYEPFGIAPLEAMSYEIPCVTSNAWALPEVVPDRICGRLVEPGNYEQLADVLTELLDDPALLKQYGQAGRKHVTTNYTWQKVVERLQARLSAKSFALAGANTPPARETCS